MRSGPLGRTPPSGSASASPACSATSPVASTGPFSASARRPPFPARSSVRGSPDASMSDSSFAPSASCSSSPALRWVQEVLRLAIFTRDALDREACALPELVVIDLCDGGSEAVLELGLRGLDVLALAFERAAFGEVQLDAENADISSAHDRASGALGGGGRLAERRPLDRTCLEGLDDVALLHVVEAVEQDPALESFGDFAC